MSKGFFGLIGFLLVALLLGSFGLSGYRYFFGINPNSPEGEYSFVLESGEQLSDIAETLERDEVAQDSFLTTARLYRVNTLYPGRYTLQLPATTREIIEQINAEAGRIAAELPASGEAVRVTFREGVGVAQMADILVEEGVLGSTQEFLDLATAPGNFEYEFLPTPLNCAYGDRFNCIQYYLEGYLYPDTYEFFADATPRDILTRMLNNFETKVWSQVGARARTGNFAEVVTMASVIELETGRPALIPGEPATVLENERRQVASVFYNRLEQGIPWSSDPTVKYGISNPICQQTIELQNCVFLNDPLVQTPYNTYANAGYPIGPVTNPQLATIQAALNPAQTDFLFFVASSDGVTRFAETDQGHIQNIAEATRRNQEIEANR